MLRGRSLTWLFDKYKKFWEEGAIAVYTSIIHAHIEIITHPTGRVINYDLWMERISAIVLSDAHAKKFKCLYDSDDIMIVHQITNAANGSRDAVCTCLQKKMEC